MSLDIRELPKDEETEILLKYFTSPIRKGYILANGCTMPEHFRDFAQEILDFPVRQDDVFVCGVPKCGTSWLQEMTWCIANNLDLNKAKQTFVMERFPLLELSSLLDMRDLQSSENIVSERFSLNSVRKLREQPGPRFIKTHLPVQLLPLGLRDEHRLAKVIYVTRDPRDCCISYYHYTKSAEGYSGDFQNFLKLFLAGRVSCTPFWDHVLGFWKIRHQPNMLFITYEEMKNDLDSVIRKVCKFLGKTYADDQIDVFKHHLSFDSMRNNKSVNYETVMDFPKKLGLKGGDGIFMRSGQSGQFRKAMTNKEIEMFNEWTRKNLEENDFAMYQE